MLCARQLLKIISCSYKNILVPYTLQCCHVETLHSRGKIVKYNSRCVGLSVPEFTDFLGPSIDIEL